MKVILDNIIFSLQKMGGISVYWHELLKRLVRDERFDLEVFQFESGENHVLGHSLKKIAARLQNPMQKETKIPVRIARYLPFGRKPACTSLFHSSYYRIAKNAINIVTIHDFTYEYYRHGLAKWIHLRQKNYAIKNAAGIICISENTRQDLFRFFPQIKVPVKVIHNGKSDAFHVLAETYQYSDQINDLKSLKFVLFVGARAGYKNFSALVDALVNCGSISLVIVGAPLTREEKIHLIQKINGRFIFIGFVDVVQLNELYNQAFCFIYPSEYEGFGIPIIEAMAAGCPVIAMAKSSIPEVAGNAGLLVEYLDSHTLLDSFSLLDDDLQRNKIISRGVDHAKNFSWDKCYAETMSFYKKINELN
ncbi:MAG: glycosyltransferase family 4 protein [gamma proteobacterium symbiont of Taylorina sp.]|nr:glycosyltransferase family 4 protein [gamma proteobacterium symbiont of Taylorina sp.]